MIHFRMSDFGTESNLCSETYKQGSAGEGTFKKRLGIIATCVVGGSLVALYAVTGPFVAPALRKVCLPFVPATRTQIENVLTVLKTRSGSLVDIGSGDGRIVSFLIWTIFVFYLEFALTNSIIDSVL